MEALFLFLSIVTLNRKNTYVIFLTLLLQALSCNFFFFFILEHTGKNRHTNQHGDLIYMSDDKITPRRKCCTFDKIISRLDVHFWNTIASDRAWRNTTMPYRIDLPEKSPWQKSRLITTRAACDNVRTVHDR